MLPARSCGANSAAAAATTTRAERSEDKPRAGLLTDRKGRRVLVERFKAKAPPPERPEPETRQRSPRGRGRRSPDRASGARPHRPRKS